MHILLMPYHKNQCHTELTLCNTLLLLVSISLKQHAKKPSTVLYKQANTEIEYIFWENKIIINHYLY